MNVSKALLLFVSLAAIVSSVWIYLNQKDSRIKPPDQSAEAKIKVEGYNLYRHKQDTLLARVSGIRAKMTDDGHLIFEEKVKAVRQQKNGREELEAKYAEVKFTGETALNSGKSNQVETIKLRENVEFLRGTMRFQSKDLLYTDSTGVVETENPVQIDSEGQFIASDGGMKYNLKTDAIHLQGGVFGSVRSDIIDSNGNKEHE